MPTTVNGFVYDQVDFVTPNGSDARITIPANTPAADAPTLIFCHGNNGDRRQFTGTAYADFFDSVVEHGIPVLQATVGAAAGNVGSNNYANDYGLATYHELVAAAEAILDVGPLLVMGGSAGGAVASNLAVVDPLIAPRCAGLCLHRGVVNLARWRSGNNLGTQTAPVPLDPQWHRWQPGVYFPPYGLLGAASDADYLASPIPARDPMLFPDAAWQAVGQVLNLVGEVDDTVPPYWHGKMLHARLLPLLGAGAVLKETIGSDHSDNTPSTYGEVTTFRMWLIATAGPFPRGPGPHPWSPIDAWYRRRGVDERILGFTYKSGGRYYRVNEFVAKPDPDRNVYVRSTTTPPPTTP